MLGTQQSTIVFDNLPCIGYAYVYMYRYICVCMLHQMRTIMRLRVEKNIWKGPCLQGFRVEFYFVWVSGFGGQCSSSNICIYSYLSVPGESN